MIVVCDRCRKTESGTRDEILRIGWRVKDEHDLAQYYWLCTACLEAARQMRPATVDRTLGHRVRPRRKLR